MPPSHPHHICPYTDSPTTLSLLASSNARRTRNCVTSLAVAKWTSYWMQRHLPCPPTLPPPFPATAPGEASMAPVFRSAAAAAAATGIRTRHTKAQPAQEERRGKHIPRHLLPGRLFVKIRGKERGNSLSSGQKIISQQLPLTVVAGIYMPCA